MNASFQSLNIWRTRRGRGLILILFQEFFAEPLLTSFPEINNDLVNLSTTIASDVP